MPRKNRQKTGNGPGGRRRTSWGPGQSGNPKGRPILPADYKLGIEDLGPRGLQALSDIVESPDHPQHADVCKYVVNRWKGTPTVKTEIGGPGGGPIAVASVLTSDEKRARLRELAEKAAAMVTEHQADEAARGNDPAIAGSD